MQHLHTDWPKLRKTYVYKYKHMQVTTIDEKRNNECEREYVGMSGKFW